MYAVELLQPTYLQDRSAERAVERAAAIKSLSDQLNAQNVSASAAAGPFKPVSHPSAMTQVLKQRPMPVRAHSGGVFENIFHGFRSVATGSRASTPCPGTPVEKTEAEAMMAARQRDIDMSSVPTLMRPW